MILGSKFRIFHRHIELHPKNADKVLMAAVCLHNFLGRQCGEKYIPKATVDHYDERNRLVKAPRRLQEHLDQESTLNRNPIVAAKLLREALADYFLTLEGEISWQHDAALYKKCVCVHGQEKKHLLKGKHVLLLYKMLTKLQDLYIPVFCMFILKATKIALCNRYRLYLCE